MSTLPNQVERLKRAEQQFRLACTVNLAVANGVQTLDVPVEWTFGHHRVSYADFGLRNDQADFAASQLELTATLVLAGVVRDAIVASFPDPKSHEDIRVKFAYQISRMIRNAFAHSFVAPRWSIDSDCRNQKYSIDKIIELDTTSLHDQPLCWQHYGGPLAMFMFGRFVRVELLKDQIDPSRTKPAFPKLETYQQGRLILNRIEALPEGAIEVARAGPGERLELGGGHYVVVPAAKEG